MEGGRVGGCIVLPIQISRGKTSESFTPTPRMGNLGHIALSSSPDHCLKVALGCICLQLSKFSGRRKPSSRDKGAGDGMLPVGRSCSEDRASLYVVAKEDN